MRTLPKRYLAMRRPPKEIQFTSYDELISGPSELGRTAQIVNIALSDLFTFKAHPFYVLDDTKMEELVESIKTHGVLIPGIVRPRQEGGYEIIAGHRRKRACELAGLTTMPAFIKEYTDDEATIIVVDSNIQREGLLPSEKARAYRMKYEAMKHQGSKEGGLTLDVIGEVSGESGKTVQRYIWLSRLSDELLTMIDNRKLPLMAGIEISFLSRQQQEYIQKVLEEKPVIITRSQARQLRECQQSEDLGIEKIRAILSSEERKRRKFIIEPNKLNEYFGNDISDTEIEEIIFRLLADWKKQR